MSERLAKVLSVGTLAAWSAGLLYLYFSERVIAFLHPSFRPLVLISGLVLAVLAGLYYILVKPASCCGGHDHEGHHHDHDDHAHSHGGLTLGRWMAFIVVLLPMLSALAFSPDQFGANTLKNRLPIEDVSLLPNRMGEMSSEWLPLPGMEGEAMGSLVDYLPKSEDGFVQIEVVDLMHGAEDETLRGELTDLPVELIGQSMPASTNNPKQDRFRLNRLFMMCCAADARPVGILIERDADVEPPPGEWVKIKGVASYLFEGGKYIPIIRAQKIEPTTAPREMMLF